MYLMSVDLNSILETWYNMWSWQCPLETRWQDPRTQAQCPERLQITKYSTLAKYKIPGGPLQWFHDNARSPPSSLYRMAR